MDLSALRSLLFLLLLTGFSAAQDHILPDGPLEALIGKNFTVKTLVDKPNYSFIIWNFNDGKEQIHIATLGASGLKVNIVYKDRATIDRTNGSLTLAGLKAVDSGEYNINIISPDGDTTTGEIELRVLQSVSDVVIKSNVPEAIEVNTTVVLTCTAKGSFLKFSWLNSTVVPDGKRITLKDNETSSVLTLTSVYRTDLVGPIFCSAANSLSSGKSAPFNLTVYYGPEAVSITPQSPPEFIATKSNFSLSCSAVSSPAPTYTWFHDDMQLEFAGPVLQLATIEAHGVGKKKAKYTCKAVNDKTKKAVSSAAVSFTIIEPLSGVKLSSPSGQLFAGNSSANLSCVATLGTVNTVTWSKDGKALAASSRVVFSGNMSSVRINPLQAEDNGEYTCLLSNPVNSVSATVKIAVIYGPDSGSITGKPGVEVNDQVKLECSAPSVPPATYIWKFNGTKTEVTTPVFTIDNAAYSNTGTYTCEAFNNVTGKSIVKSHFLAVKAEGELDEGLSDGAIAGIVIGVIAAVAIAIGLFIYCRQKVPLESPY